MVNELLLPYSSLETILSINNGQTIQVKNTKKSPMLATLRAQRDSSFGRLQKAVLFRNERSDDRKSPGSIAGFVPF